MNSIAIIPARGGSKRVPRKNIKLLNGIPLISHTIRQAFDSKVFNKIIVSTEDDEIAQVSIDEGAEVMYRPLALAEDVETELVLQHVIETLEGKKYPVKIVTLLQCTSPLRKPETIKRCVQLLSKNIDTLDSVITISNIEGGRPEWMGSVEGTKFIPYTDTWVNEQGRYIKLVARQDLPILYHQNGCVYSFKKELLINSGLIIGANCGAVIIGDTEAHDLDTELDFHIAEALMKNEETISY
jgi:CMP-N,N'-diacetyllegionaminic acid synthase